MARQVNNQTNYNDILPEINTYIWRPILSTPQLCTYFELKTGKIDLYDLEKMHQALDLKQHATQTATAQAEQMRQDTANQNRFVR